MWRSPWRVYKFQIKLFHSYSLTVSELFRNSSGTRGECTLEYAGLFQSYSIVVLEQRWNSWRVWKYQNILQNLAVPEQLILEPVEVVQVPDEPIFEHLCNIHILYSTWVWYVF